MGHKILVPVDFQETSKRALEVALGLATKLDARVVLLHVHPLAMYSYAYPGIAPPLMPQLGDELMTHARRSLDLLASQSRIEDRILRAGDPADEILAVIEETEPMMVVMGTHGRRGFARLLVGSVAAEVVRRSHVPVLTVGPPREEADDVGRTDQEAVIAHH
jgi:nucleotide-binding universal stress UspA family protein